MTPNSESNLNAKCVRCAFVHKTQSIQTSKHVMSSHTIAFQISGHNAALSIWSAIVHLPCEIDEQIGQMDIERNFIHATNGVAHTHVDHFDVHRFHSDQLNPNQNWYGINRGIYGNNRQSTHWTLICFCFVRKYATCIRSSEWMKYRLDMTQSTLFNNTLLQTSIGERLVWHSIPYWSHTRRAFYMIANWIQW